MVASAILSVPFGDELNAQAIGLVLVLLSMMAAATRPVMAAVLMGDAKESGLSPLVLVWYDSLISSSILLIFSLAIELPGLKQYFAEQPVQGVWIIALGSAMAFCYNIVTFNLTKAVGSLASAVLGNVKQVLLIAISAFAIDHMTSFRSILGISLFSAFCGWYTYLVVQVGAAALPGIATSCALLLCSLMSPASFLPRVCAFRRNATP